MFIPRRYALFVVVALMLTSCQTQANQLESVQKVQNTTSATAPPTSTGTPAAWLPENLFGNGQGNANVEFVHAVQETNGSWTFHVRVNHPDQGWEDFADGWDIVLPDGKVLKPDPQSKFSRTLLHPHVDEQPFTRSLSGLHIPNGIDEVLVRAHDLVDGFGGQVVIVNFRELSGVNYLVEIVE